MTSIPALRIKDFSFRYSEKIILKNINLSIQEGEYIAIIGPNGMGKSTLLKCINRILKGGNGNIEIYGKNINNYNQKSLAQLIGYVPQTMEPTFSFTVREFVLMGRYPYLKPFASFSHEDEKLVDETMKLIGITRFANRKIHQLSGGEKQKVYIASCLAQQPKILLFDEPTSHLDPKHVRDVHHTISDISKRLNKTIIHVTHNLTHIVHSSQKIIAIHKGKIEFMGTPQQVITKENLTKIFETDFHLIDDPASNSKFVIPDIGKSDYADFKT